MRKPTPHFAWIQNMLAQHGPGFDLMKEYKKKFGALPNTTLVAAVRKAARKNCLGSFTSSSEVVKWYYGKADIPASDIVPASSQEMTAAHAGPGLQKAMQDLARMMMAAQIQRLGIDLTQEKPKFAISILREEQFTGTLE